MVQGAQGEQRRLNPTPCLSALQIPLVAAPQLPPLLPDTLGCASLTIASRFTPVTELLLKIGEEVGRGDATAGGEQPGKTTLRFCTE